MTWEDKDGISVATTMLALLLIAGALIYVVAK
jgi:hypothetical protein